MTTLNLAKSVKGIPDKVKEKVKKSQLGNNNNNFKVKDNRERHIFPQYQCKIEYPKDIDSQTKNTNNKTYHWCSHHYMLIIHNIYHFEIVK